MALAELRCAAHLGLRARAQRREDLQLAPLLLRRERAKRALGQVLRLRADGIVRGNGGRGHCGRRSRRGRGAIRGAPLYQVWARRLAVRRRCRC